MYIYLRGKRIDEKDFLKDIRTVIQTTGGYEREIHYPNPTTFTCFMRCENISTSSSPLSKLEDICRTLSQLFDQSIVLLSTDLGECTIKMLNSWGGQIIICYGETWKIKSFQPNIIFGIKTPVNEILNILFREIAKRRA